MTKRLVLAVSLSLGLGCLAGCGASSSGGWTKPGMTEQQLGRDTMECLSDSSFMVPGGAMSPGPRESVDQDRYRRCMGERGYTAGPPK